LAWSGFILTRTVLDPERSRDVADALYEDEAVRSALVDNIADAVEAALPEGVSLERSAIESGAARALESPAVEAVFVDAFVQTHGALLGEGEAPESVDPGAFGAAAREALVAERPELDAVLPAAPQLAVPLPTERVPNLGPVRDVLLAVVPILALVSAAGGLLALVVTSNRPAVVRRAGFWAIGLSAAVLAFAYGIPALASRYAPDQSEVVAALIGAMAAAARGPALALAGAGLAGVVASVFWKAAPALTSGPARPREAAATATPIRSRGGPVKPAISQRRDLPRPARGARAPAPTTVAPRPRAPDGDGCAQPPSAPRPRHASSGSAPTIVDGSRPSDAAFGEGSRRWVDGVGWVLESSAEEIPARARWVPGVGYVVDDA